MIPTIKNIILRDSDQSTFNFTGIIASNDSIMKAINNGNEIDPKTIFPNSTTGVDFFKWSIPDQVKHSNITTNSLKSILDSVDLQLKEPVQILDLSKVPLDIYSLFRLQDLLYSEIFPDLHIINISNSKFNSIPHFYHQELLLLLYGLNKCRKLEVIEMNGIYLLLFII